MSSEAPKWAISRETAGPEAASSPDQHPSDTSVMLVPITRMPFDILQIIFTLCQDKTISTFPFTASHVCRLWREYVLAMPLLWGSLHIRERVPRWEMLKVMLQRSDQAPLNIYINELPFMQSAVPRMRKIMRMILPHVARWRSLHLTDVPHKVRRILLDQIRAKPAPNLEEINVFQDSFLQTENRSPNWRAQNLFVGFHNLTSVAWTSYTSSLRNLPTFRNLKNLTIGHGTFEDEFPPLLFIQLIHRTLSDSPSLETFKICHDPLIEPEAINLQLPTIAHYSLQTLIIESSLEVRSAAMRTLILPKLRTLSHDYFDEMVNLSCCNIIAQDNSLRELRVITMSGDIPETRITANHIPSLRAHMPFLGPAIRNLVNLRVLILRLIDFEGGKWLPDLGICCPHLRWLLFVGCIGCPISSIRLLVEKRMHTEGINPLEILCIDQHGSEPWESRLTRADVGWFFKFLTLKTRDDWVASLIRSAVSTFNFQAYAKGFTARPSVISELLRDFAKNSKRRFPRSKAEKQREL
ncbi:hypothetical protein FRC00_004286, partial [Tulasnella sp. 408]